MNNRLLITFLILFIFSIIDSGIFLLGEERLSDILEKYTFLDKYTSPILVGALAAGISMMIASSIKMNFFSNIKLIENPFIDFVSIISGAIVIILIYHII
jgi:hypothetical protein